MYQLCQVLPCFKFVLIMFFLIFIGKTFSTHCSSQNSMVMISLFWVRSRTKGPIFITNLDCFRGREILLFMTETHQLTSLNFFVYLLLSGLCRRGVKTLTEIIFFRDFWQIFSGHTAQDALTHLFNKFRIFRCF